MNEKRGPAAEKKRRAQMDQRYQNIIRRFGSIEAYEQARQEGKFYKPPPPIVEKPKIKKGYKGGGMAGMRRFNRGGKV